MLDPKDKFLLACLLAKHDPIELIETLASICEDIAISVRPSHEAKAAIYEDAAKELIAAALELQEEDCHHE